MPLPPQTRVEPTLNVAATRPPSWPIAQKPRLAKRIANASAALWRNLMQLIRGTGLRAVKRERRVRESICRACEYQRDNICTRCGCNLRFKTWLNAEECPLEKW